jgi:hypothetical protein
MNPEKSASDLRCRLCDESGGWREGILLRMVEVSMSYPDIGQPQQKQKPGLICTRCVVKHGMERLE